MSVPSAERPHHARRQRTRFSEGQLRVLRDVFNETKRPDWDTVQALAARLQLDVAVIKVCPHCVYITPEPEIHTLLTFITTMPTRDNCTGTHTRETLRFSDNSDI
jgi:hypothetical protein